MKQALIYSLKIWLTAVVIAPIVTEIVDYLIRAGSTDEGVFYFILLSIPYGLLLSLPCWVLLWLAVYLIGKTGLSITYKKVLLSVIGLALTVLPFYLVFGHDDGSNTLELWIWPFSYTLVIIAGIWFYKPGMIKQ